MNARALVAAAAAAAEAWRGCGLAKRLAVLSDAGRELSERREELYAGLRADGLSTALAHHYGAWILHQGDPDLLARYARELIRWADGPGSDLLVRRPDGVVLLVTPANSPTINGSSLFPILLPGNAVVARAPGNDEGLRFLADDVLGNAFVRHGLPREVVQTVTGKTREVLAALAPAPEIRTLVFFGNSTAGAAVAETALRAGKKVVLELEGSDHLVVWRDAPVEAAVASALHAFDFSTQPCPVPKHFLVHGEAYERFVERLVARLPEWSRTIAADPEHGQLAPVAGMDRYEEALAEAREHGTVLAGGYRMAADGTPDPTGPYAAPTLVAFDPSTVVVSRLLCFKAEISYPLVPVLRFEGTDADVASAMLGVLRESPFGLRVSVWAEDPEVVGRFAAEVGNTGLLVLGDEHARCPTFAAPWGGPGRSGGPAGENHLFWEKTSHLQALSCERLVPAQVHAVAKALGAADLIELPPLRPPVGLSIRDGVATIELCRPERHNAVDDALRAALDRALDEVEAAVPDGVRAVVVRGAGPSFSSGADLRALEHASTAGKRRFMFEATWAFRRLEQLPVPVVAAVHGYCLGGGFELALHCDLVVAAEDAVFGFPETGIGLVTTAGSVHRLVAAIGTARARELLVTGRRMGAEEALRVGLVVEVVPAAALDGAVGRRADALRAMPAGGVEGMKRLVRRIGTADAEASWIAEMETFDALIRARSGR